MKLLKKLFLPKHTCAICGKTEYSRENIIQACQMGLFAGKKRCAIRTSLGVHSSCIKDVICNPEKYNGPARRIALNHTESEIYIQEKEAKELERIKELQKEICS